MERPKLDNWFERTDAQLLEEEQRLVELKDKLRGLDEIEAEDILCGWFKDYREIDSQG